MRESFPGHRVEIVNSSGGPEPVRPFRVTFPEPEAPPAGKKRKADGPAEAAAEAAELPLVRVESYKPPDPGPYPQNQPRQNPVRFTPVQVEAIKAGAQPGLTMVVGPPGGWPLDLHCRNTEGPGCGLPATRAPLNPTP